MSYDVNIVLISARVFCIEKKKKEGTARISTYQVRRVRQDFHAVDVCSVQVPVQVFADVDVQFDVARRQDFGIDARDHLPVVGVVPFDQRLEGRSAPGHRISDGRIQIFQFRL